MRMFDFEHELVEFEHSYLLPKQLSIHFHKVVRGIFGGVVATG